MSDVFDALAHPTRRRIVGLLRKRAMSAGEIADKLDIAKPQPSIMTDIRPSLGLAIAVPSH